MISLSEVIELPKNKLAKSERAEVLKYFVENLFDRNKKHYKASRIGIALAHLKLNDLYYLKSICQDIQNRRGNDAMNKYFWWSLKN